MPRLLPECAKVCGLPRRLIPRLFFVERDDASHRLVSSEKPSSQSVIWTLSVSQEGLPASRGRPPTPAVRQDRRVETSAIRRVLVFPVNGYLNRLQAIASAALLARRFDATLQVCWPHFTNVPGPPSDTFAAGWCDEFTLTEDQVRSEFAVGLDDVPRYVTTSPDGTWVGLRGHDRGEQALMGELTAVLDSSAAPVDLVIVAGGSFDISDPTCVEGAWSESFLSAKRDFYRSLPLNSAIESAGATFSSAHPLGYLGLHLRYSDRAHQAPTPWAIKRALARLAADTGLTDVFIASDSPRARSEWSKRVEAMGLRPWDLSASFSELASATSAGPALGDWRILAGSTRLVFFAESSYSVEACVASGSWASSSALPTSRARAVGHRALSHLRAAVTYPARHLKGR